MTVKESVEQLKSTVGPIDKIAHGIYINDVLYTLQPGDLLGWGQSIKHRGLIMPASIHDEFLQLAAEVRH